MKTEITFKIERSDTRDVVTIYEEGIKTHVSYYHKGMNDGELIAETAKTWWGPSIGEFHAKD